MNTVFKTFQHSPTLSTLAALLWLAPLAVQAEDYTYITNNGTITIIGYNGPGGGVSIPGEITGLPVTATWYFAFAQDTVTGVNIPSSLTNIDSRTFSRCPNLTAFTVDPLNPAYSAADGILFNTNRTTLLICAPGRTGSITVPNTVTAIGAWAFYSCTNLTAITLPDTVTSIGDGAFYCCTSLTGINIPEAVTTIGFYAFARTALTGVAIPGSITSIGEGAFTSCLNLTAITVHPTNLFFSSREAVLFNKSQTTLIQCPAGKTGNYTAPQTVTVIQAYAFESCGSIMTIALPDQMMSLGDMAFYMCGRLQSISIPHGVPSVGLGAFAGCWSLTNVVIPDTVTHIGDFAFTECISLPSVAIPDSVTTIGESAFESCFVLTNICIGHGLIELGPHAFAACYSLTEVFFRGDYPMTLDTVFEDWSFHEFPVIHYLAGTRWGDWPLGSIFCGRPTRAKYLPNPVVLDFVEGYGVRTNRFGFRISWATDASVVIDACTGLSTGTWSPLKTNTLLNGWTYFSDPDWTNHPARFYRIRSP